MKPESCKACTLYEQPIIDTPMLKAKVLIIGKCPTMMEAENSGPFSDKAWNLLDACLKDFPISSDMTYLVKCVPPGERTPNKKEINQCMEFLINEITFREDLELIVCIGDTVMEAVLGKKGIIKLNGNIFFDTPVPTAVCIDPEYVLKTGNLELLEKGMSSVIAYFKEPEPALKYIKLGDVPFILDELITVDIETTGKRPLEGQVKSIAFSTSNKNFYTDDVDWDIMSTNLEENHLICHQAQFEHAWFLKEGISAKIVHDTRLIGYLIDENSSTSLENMCIKYEIDVAYKPEDISDLVKQGGEALAQYNVRDTRNTMKLFNIVWPLLPEQCKDVYQNVLMPATKTLALIELAGMYIEPERITECTNELNNLIKELDLKNDEYIKELESLSEKPFNIKSTPQRKILIYDLLGYEPKVFTDTGAPSTKADGLEKLLRERHTHTLEKLIRYSEYRGWKDNFLNVMYKNLVEINDQNFVFTSLWLGDTLTGRLKSNNPNLQNIPKNFTRRIFTSRFEDGYLLDFDYDQAELRILAGLSQDPALIEIFQGGRDPHTETAEVIFDKKTVTEKERALGKRINFAIPTGSSPGRIAYECGITMQEAQLMLRRYWKRFKILDQYFKSLPEEGTVWSPTGMKRTAVGPRAKNQIRNFAVQNAALIMHLKALNELVPIQIDLGNIVVLPTHDSVLSDCRHDFKETYYTVKEVLENVTFDWLPIPLTVSGKVGLDWGNMTEINDKLLKEV